MAGRKGYGEELKITRRYAALTEPFFNALQEFLNSEDKADRKFAIQELNKGFTKMIPTQLTGEEGGAIIIQVAKEGLEKYATPPGTVEDTPGQA